MRAGASPATGSSSPASPTSSTAVIRTSRFSAPTRSPGRTAPSGRRSDSLLRPSSSARSGPREEYGLECAMLLGPTTRRLTDNHRLSPSTNRLRSMPLSRREFMQGLGVLALASLPPHARADHAAGAASQAADWCSAGARAEPLFVPRDRGFLGRLALDDQTLSLRAASLSPV